MLNRLFVIIGFIVILAIGAAFVLPRFIQWGDYRPRLEAMSSTALGTDVTIRGDISLALLPQPQLVMTSVQVGPEAAPVLSVARVEAQFSLFDFLTDRYTVTSLEIVNPVVSVSLAEDGSMQTGIELAAEAEASNVSISNATVTGGAIHLTDARSGETHSFEDIGGDLRLDALRGPFGFQGRGSFDGAGYGFRLSSGRLDDAGVMTLALAVSAEDKSFTLDTNGTLQTGDAPLFTGDTIYRRPPPRPVEGEVVDAGRGDMLLEGKVEANTDRILLSSYVLLPDENRAATRLTGAADLKLGVDLAFNAVVSGGVVALPPRDAIKELTDPPYEIIRLLGETPLPPVPGIPGRVGLDITELNLRGVSLRDVQLDATTDSRNWTIENASAALAGSTRVALSGKLDIVDGHSVFSGRLRATSQQVDRLAALWRRPPPDNPLFGLSAALEAGVELTPFELALADGSLTVGDHTQPFAARIGFGPPRELGVEAHVAGMTQAQGAMLAALLPDPATGGSFGATFPSGSVALTADSAVLFGQKGRDLALTARWDGGVLTVDQLHAGDLGGAALDLAFTAFGTLQKPEISGSGSISLAADAPIARALLDAASTPPAMSSFLRQSLPAALSVSLKAPTGEGNQALSLAGSLGTADASIDAQLSKGIVNALTAPLAATIKLASDDQAAMTVQLGLGTEPLFSSDQPMNLEMSIDGAPSESYQVRARLASGDDRIAFDGSVVPGDFTSFSGTGNVDVALADPSVLAASIGLSGLYVPPVEGTARMLFTGTDSILLDSIVAEGAAGRLSLARNGERVNVTGSLQLAALDATSLLPVLGGAAATIPGDGLWPAGPIDIGDGRRPTTGRVSIAVDEMPIGGRPLLTDAAFSVDWTADAVSIRNLTGTAGEGVLTFDATVCCGSPTIATRQLSGRLTLAGVPIDIVAPAAISNTISGAIDAAAQFSGTGDTLAAAVDSMTGSGSYTIGDFLLDGLDPQVFNAAAAFTDIEEVPVESLSVAVLTELSHGEFRSGPFTGSFTIAGGVLRSPNLAIAGEGARLFGNASLDLADMVVAARYALTPVAIAEAASMVDAATAEIIAAVSGPIWAPIVDLDVSALVDGMKIRASEIALAALEEARLAEEERQRELAAERARVAAEQAAAEAARKAAEEEARRAAEEAAAARAAAAAAAAAQQPPAPLDLGF